MSLKIYTPSGIKMFVKNKIGEGMYGKVFSATGTDNSELAIKVVIPSEYISHYDLKREAKIIKKCNNLPFVMSYEDLFIFDNKLYVIMPLYKKLPFENNSSQIARWYYQLLVGLNAIHKKGVVHGDIKIQNIMLSGDDEIRILDFGISVKSGSRERDIVPHILKSKKRIRETIDSYETIEKKQRNNEIDETIKNIFPEATYYDDLVAATYTILSMFNCGKIFQTKIMDNSLPKTSLKDLLVEMEGIQLVEKVKNILKEKCDGKLLDFFEEFMSEVFLFSENEPTIPDFLKRMEEKYFDIISIK